MVQVFIKTTTKPIHNSDLKIFTGNIPTPSDNKNLNYKQMKRALQINFDTQGDVYVRIQCDK